MYLFAHVPLEMYSALAEKIILCYISW